MMNNDSYFMNLKEYEDSMIGGLNDPEEVAKEIEEMKNAEVGHIKANCWQKISEDKFEFFIL